MPAGTVVDTAVCSPHGHDFFLVSHSGLQGTSRPVHYAVLLDENCYGADALQARSRSRSRAPLARPADAPAPPPPQAMAFRLCHTYARCHRSVSLVPPVYYAHLACARGRVLRPEDSDASSASSAGGGGAGHSRVVLHPSLADTMFFV